MTRSVPVRCELLVGVNSGDGLPDHRAYFRPGRRRGSALAIGAEEHPGILGAFDRIVPFVHKAMVAPADGNRIFEIGLAAVDPVLNMVGIDKARVGAAWKLAAAVAVLERSPQGRGNHPSLAADVDGLALLICQPGYDAAVANDYDGLDRATVECKVSGRSCIASKTKADISYNDSGDRTSVCHRGEHVRDYATSYLSGTNKISTVTYPYSGLTRTVSFAFDGRGNRTFDDDDFFMTDRRDYTYDARNNLITVSGTTREGTSGLAIDDYTLTNAYDHKNRRIFKSYYNEDTSQEAQWFSITPNYGFRHSRK